MKGLSDGFILTVSVIFALITMGITANISSVGIAINTSISNDLVYYESTSVYQDYSNLINNVKVSPRDLRDLKKLLLEVYKKNDTIVIKNKHTNNYLFDTNRTNTFKLSKAIEILESKSSIEVKIIKSNRGHIEGIEVLYV